MGETLTENNILVMDNNKQIKYDSAGEKGWKIEKNKYMIGYFFTEVDVGEHKINVIYKDKKFEVTLNITMPKIVTPKFPIQPYTSRFFKTPKVAKTIYTVNVPDEAPYKNFKNQWYILLQSLEGILAQTEARLFVYHDVPTRNSWLNEMKQECGFTTVEISPIEAINMFKNEVADSKFVAYGTGDKNISVNNATVIASVNKWLMVDNGQEFMDSIKSLGFTEGDNAGNYTTQQIFNKYKDQLNTKMLVNQSPNVLWLRDYAIASKSFVTYLDYVEDQNFWDEVMDWVDDNGPILGWTEDEWKLVDIGSKHSLSVVASDHCANLSLFTGYSPKYNSMQIHKDKITPVNGKHYIAIVMSDGDNLQWLQNDWFANNWFGSPKRGLFPMNWTINPAILDLNPQIIDRINTLRTENDSFVCGASGYGYANQTRYPDIRTFAMSCAEYMKNCDMNVAYYLDPFDKNPQAFQHSMEQSQLIGAVWGYGDRYAAGKGGVYWINNKPILCMRETLWEQAGKSEDDDCFSPKNMAKRINNYTTNPKEISGYSMVNAHCWSYGKMDKIAEMVSLLDDHVEIVSCEQLLNMISENVPHVDVEEANDYPEYYKA